jgi:hypothetical protein
LASFILYWTGLCNIAILNWISQILVDLWNCLLERGEHQQPSFSHSSSAHPKESWQNLYWLISLQSNLGLIWIALTIDLLFSCSIHSMLSLWQLIVCMLKDTVPRDSIYQNSEEVEWNGEGESQSFKKARCKVLDCIPY